MAVVEVGLGGAWDATNVADGTVAARVAAALGYAVDEGWTEEIFAAIERAFPADRADIPPPERASSALLGSALSVKPLLTLVLGNANWPPSS